MVDLRRSAVIKVVGVGGGGVNAVNTMVAAGLDGVQFVAVNTDLQSLDASTAEIHVQIGGKLTKGLGAGADPAKGKDAAEESKDDIALALDGADMVFIAAGMGGGTGTGASPVVAELAKAKGALVVGVVSKPWSFEGPIRMRQAENGIELLRAKVDALIIVPNQRLLDIYDRALTLPESFQKANDVLKQGVLGIAGLITNPGLINLDFADVRTVMTNAGSAMMGIGTASGEERAIDAANDAISNPLLEENIQGATGLIVSVTGGPDMTLHEVNDAINIVRQSADPNANIIFGASIDEAKQGEVSLTVIATGFKKTILPPLTGGDIIETEIKMTAPPLVALRKEPELQPAGQRFAFFAETPEPALSSANPDDIDVPPFLRNR
ncbi:MAG: cell division protein FtsZ [Candidatus Margulisbacteria bacterium]|jgi:cell division protein FtsZ|nr:cell division protein FtsZ [Candidatus Margulisiibacteriota bacterium]